MKIEVTLGRKRKDYQGAIYIKYVTIRVPKDVTVLNMKTVWEIVKERKKRIEVVKDYWERKPENQNKIWQGDINDYGLIAWSPIITTSALEFICQNF